MKFSTKAVLVVAALALAACSNASRFGDDVGSGVADGVGAGFDPALGDPTDPTSLAYFQQTVGDRVLFAVDQHTLTPDAELVLNGQAAWLASNPEYTIVIEGHADEQGTREYNLALGERRASSAQTYLVSQGVAASRIETVTYGKERPLEICSSEACYAKNRRAVTLVTGGAAGV